MNLKCAAKIQYFGSTIVLGSTILSLFMALHTDTLSCVRADGLNSRVVSNSEWSEARLCSGSRFLSGRDESAHGTYHSPRHGRHNYWESFSDLDFADDVALLAEMLSLVLALEVMDTVLWIDRHGGYS